MSLDDVFGPFPGRPQHRDFTVLCDIVLGLDAKSYDLDDPASYAAFIGDAVDAESITYMAMQRAMRSIGRLSQRISREDLMVALAGAWLDAFMVGYRFSQQGGDVG